MLLEDEVCFDAYFNTTPQALELHQAYEQRLKSNIAIAGELTLLIRLLRITDAAPHLVHLAVTLLAQMLTLGLTSLGVLTHREERVDAPCP